MNIPRFWISCAGISLAALLSVTSIGSAGVVKFKADLKATDEVPPNEQGHRHVGSDVRLVD